MTESPTASTTAASCEANTCTRSPFPAKRKRSCYAVDRHSPTPRGQDGESRSHPRSTVGWVGTRRSPPSEKRGHGGVAAGEVLGDEWLTVPDLVGDTNDGLRVVEATAVMEEVAVRFAVAVLAEKLGPSEPVELLDDGEYVGGGDVWLARRRAGARA